MSLLSHTGYALVTAVIFAPTLPAQVPQLISYQGRVAVSGVNFEGVGAFKFALVDAAGTITYWSNDGSSRNGGEPAAAVSLTVSKGLYSVLLGDADLTHMTAIPASAFNNADVRLRVWFNDGTNGMQKLTPDQRIVAVGYAVIAGTVPDGAITGAKIATGAVGSTQLASNAVTAGNLALGAAAANLAASNQSAVASGGVIMSASANNPALVNAGFVRIAMTQFDQFWQQKSAGSAPTPRNDHTVVWTGTEMIVWGGANPNYSASLGDGGRFNLATNTWTGVRASGAPAARYAHTAIWTGTVMVIWGGYSIGANALASDHGRYNPVSDTWAGVSSLNAPTLRTGHSAVWTGSSPAGRMIVWGGTDVALTNTGGIYDPVNDVWTAGGMSTANAPVGRYNHAAVWTGTAMIVWGGYIGGSPGNTLTGGHYTFATNAWNPAGMSATNAPSPRESVAAVWTGTQMLIWGGFDRGANQPLNDGKIYDPNPLGDSWTTMPNSPLQKRVAFSTVWTGSEMIVWAGFGTGGIYGDGARFDPATAIWTTMTPSGAPSSRYNHRAVWAGTEMLVWGGSSDANTSAPNIPYLYSPGAIVYLYQRP